jgi:hypothetical protein
VLAQLSEPQMITLTHVRQNMSPPSSLGTRAVNS